MESTRHPPPIDASKLVWPPSATPRGAPAAAASSPASPAAASSSSSSDAASPDPFVERPELYVGAAFACGIVLAGLLRVMSR